MSEEQTPEGEENKTTDTGAEGGESTAAGEGQGQEAGSGEGSEGGDQAAQ